MFYAPCQKRIYNKQGGDFGPLVKSSSKNIQKWKTTPLVSRGGGIQGQKHTNEAHYGNCPFFVSALPLFRCSSSIC